MSKQKEDRRRAAAALKQQQEEEVDADATSSNDDSSSSSSSEDGDDDGGGDSAVDAGAENSPQGEGNPVDKQMQYSIMDKMTIESTRLRQRLDSLELNGNVDQRIIDRVRYCTIPPAFI